MEHIVVDAIQILISFLLGAGYATWLHNRHTKKFYLPKTSNIYVYHCHDCGINFDLRSQEDIRCWDCLQPMSFLYIKK